MKTQIVVGLIIIALLVGVGCGYCIWMPTWYVASLTEYDIFQDVLGIVLAITAIGIGTAGYAIYLILSGRLKNESAEAARTESLKGSTLMFLHSGFVFWVTYDKQQIKDIHHIEMAIYLTERALRFFNEIPTGEAKNRGYNELLCKIKNNLAYYYAERKKPEDRNTAREFADYLRHKSTEYFENRENWTETCNFVKQQYPD